MNSKRQTARLKQSRASLFKWLPLGAILHATAYAQPSPPQGLSVGDTYHLVFITDGFGTATSTDIADYNAFAQAEAEREGSIVAGVGDWFAIGSTPTVDARDNALISAPVFDIRGWKIADGFESFWNLPEPPPFDGSPFSDPKPIALDQFGEGESHITWTGTQMDGTAAVDDRGSYALGDPHPAVGSSRGGSNTRIARAVGVFTSPLHPFYALSELLTVTIPNLPGDFNNNGMVEQSDLDLVLLNWGQVGPPYIEGWISDPPILKEEPLNQISSIDQDDLDRVLLNWGNVRPAIDVYAVPEPAVWWLALAILVGIIIPATWTGHGAAWRWIDGRDR